jgi:hypothetical protein
MNFLPTNRYCPLKTVVANSDFSRYLSGSAQSPITNLVAERSRIWWLSVVEATQLAWILDIRIEILDVRY